MNYLLKFETPSLPAWARTRLHDIPTGMSAAGMKVTLAMLYIQPTYLDPCFTKGR